MAEAPDKPIPQYDRLTSQLYHLPSIIGRLGISIAEAQKELNLDYVNSVGRLMELIKTTVGADNAAEVPAMQSLLEALAPSRYQFTETTIEFSADLSESVQKGVQIGASVGAGAVMVNAAMTLGYAHDYRASARITSVLHARPAGGDPEFPKALLARKQEIDAAKLALPPAAQVDKDILDRVGKVYEALKG
jgi:hypothetical protein